MRRCCVVMIAMPFMSLLAASTAVPRGNDGQSLTVGASWLQRRANDVIVEEVVHSLEDYDEPTTTSAATNNSYDAHTHSVSVQY